MNGGTATYDVGSGLVKDPGSNCVVSVIVGVGKVHGPRDTVCVGSNIYVRNESKTKHDFNCNGALSDQMC